MINWKRWSGNSKSWNDTVQKLPDFTLFQSFEWGSHRERFGWTVSRFIAYDEGDPVAIAQVLVRRFPFRFGIIWIPGGPAGQKSTFNSDYIKLVCRENRINFYYCRLNGMEAETPGSIDTLQSNGWSRVSRKLSSGISLTYSPSLPKEDRLLMCSGNWRHNLRRSFKRSLFTSVWSNPDANMMMNVYKNMQEIKNIPDQTSVAEIQSILTSFGKQCLIVRCDDEKGDFIALRGAILMGSKAWDIFAATSSAGRKVYASHAAFWELMSQCAALGVISYDMGGADPMKNRGVYDFKKGTGATEIKQLGEWDLSYPKFTRYIVSQLIVWRGKI